MPLIDMVRLVAARADARLPDAARADARLSARAVADRCIAVLPAWSSSIRAAIGARAGQLLQELPLALSPARLQFQSPVNLRRPGNAGTTPRQPERRDSGTFALDS
jgi:hypothetical protein